MPPGGHRQLESSGGDVAALLREAEEADLGSGGARSHLPPGAARPDAKQRLTAGNVLAVQQTAGNQAVQRLIDMGQVNSSIRQANRYFTRNKSSLRGLLDAVDAYNAGGGVTAMENKIADLEAIAIRATAAHANPTKAKYQAASQTILDQVEVETKDLLQSAIDDYEANPSLPAVQAMGRILERLDIRPDKAKYGALINQMKAAIASENATGGGIAPTTTKGKGKGEVKFKISPAAKARQEAEAAERERLKALAAAKKDEEEEDEEESESAEE